MSDELNDDLEFISSLLLLILVCMMIWGCSIQKKTSTKALEIDKTIIETLSNEKKDNAYTSVISIDTTKTNFINIIINEKQTITQDSNGVKTIVNEKQTIYNNENKENHIYNQKSDSLIDLTNNIKTTVKKDIENKTIVKSEIKSNFFNIKTSIIIFTIIIIVVIVIWKRKKFGLIFKIMKVFIK